MEIRKARIEETDEIVSIYKSLISYEGCLWNEYYPSKEDVINDINNDTLYIIKKDEIIVAVAHAGIDEELFKEECLFTEISNPRDLARVAVRPDYQKQGLAKTIIKYIEEDLKSNGVDYMILTAGKTNEKALRLYKSLNYKIVGQLKDHGFEMLIHEKKIN